MKLAGIAVGLGGALLAWQSIGPDEMRVRKMPYTPPTAYTIRAESSLVEVSAVVHDSVGRVVPGLTKDDFEILDVGKRREIAAFSVQTPFGAYQAAPAGSTKSHMTFVEAPAKKRYVAVVFDDIIEEGPPPTKAIQLADLAIMKRETKRYFQESLSPGDRISIFGIYFGQVLPFSTDPGKLSAAIDQARTIARLDKPGMAPQILGTLEDIVEYLAKLPGERMLLLASRGFLAPWSSQQQADLIHRALRGGVVIEAIDTKGLDPDGGPIRVGRGGARGVLSPTRQVGQQVNDVMHYVAEATGGEFFHNSNDMLAGLKSTISPEIRYLMAFQPDAAEDGKYHPLKVRITSKPHHEVIARPGYYATSSQPAPPAPERPVDRMVLSDQSVTDVAARVTVSPDRLEDGAPALRAVAHLDLRSMLFRMEKERHAEKVTYLAVLQDDHGGYVTGKEAVIELALEDATLAKLSEAGISCTLVLDAPAGKYRLRIVVQESNGSKMTAATQAVEIR